jgi:hypothetical protein
MPVLIPTLSVAPSTIVARLASGDLADQTPTAVRSLMFNGVPITPATVAGGDLVLIQDLDDSLILKTVTAQSIADLASSVGDVIGPAGATNEALARYDTGTGKLLQNSLVLVDDAGAMTGLTGVDVTGNITVSGNVDGRDISSDGSQLDTNTGLLAGIEPGADVTDEANVTLALDGATPGLITPDVADLIYLQDDSDSNNLKLATVQNIVDLASGGAGVGPNLIINGNMEIAQRGTSFVAILTNNYALDRWSWAQSGNGVVTITQDSDVPSVLVGSSLGVDVTTADGSISAAELYSVRYRVEGFDAIPLNMGIAGASNITLSFWVRSTITGVHCAAFRNSASDRSYVAEYTIDVTDTWEFKTITLTGDLTGTWLIDTGIGLNLDFVIAAGTNFHTTPDAWAAGEFLATLSQVNGMSNAANFFKIKQVKLEVGSAATAFTPRPFAEELALCKRYYQKTFPYSVAPAQNAGSESALQYTCLRAGVSITRYEWNLPVQLRIDPAGGTQIFYSPGAATSDWWNSTPTAQLSGISGVQGVTGENRVVISNLQVANDQLTDLIQIHATVDVEL